MIFLIWHRRRRFMPLFTHVPIASNIFWQHLTNSFLFYLSRILYSRYKLWVHQTFVSYLNNALKYTFPLLGTPTWIY